MEKYYSQTIGLDIITSDGGQAGRIIEVVVEPETGKILGFLLAPHGERVITPADILFWSDQMSIEDSDDISDQEDIVKIQKTLEKHIPIMKNRVMTENGVYLGHVIDFTIHTRLFVLTKIFIAKTFLGIIHYDEKIIPHRHIMEIKKDVIIVKNPAGAIPVKEEKGKLHVDVATST